MLKLEKTSFEQISSIREKVELQIWNGFLYHVCREVRLNLEGSVRIRVVKVIWSILREEFWTQIGEDSNVKTRKTS